MHSKEEKLEQFSRLLDVMDALRARCPWNAAQTNESLRKMTIEEVYELSDAVLGGSVDELRKELGDVLLHIVFYSKIAEERGDFDIADVAAAIADKMVFRHPHVFAEGADKMASAEDVASTWELVKMKEKGGNKRILSGVPESMPPLLKAMALQQKASGCGFDWSDRREVWAKVKEEIGEFEQELLAMQDASDPEAKARAESELGDILFSIVNAARLYSLDPDAALDGTCRRFRRRFTYVEENTIRQGLDFKDVTLEQMDALWDEAKKKGL